MVELAKAMKNHNITFLTQQMSKVYIDIEVYSSSSFHVVYGNDTPDAWVQEKIDVDNSMSPFANHSFFDALAVILPMLAEAYIPLLNKAIHILLVERFDVIIAGKMVFGTHALCEKLNIPCVIQSPSFFPNMFEFNLPNFWSLMTSKELTQIAYRIYNVAFTMRLVTKMVPKLAPTLYKIFHSLPRIPGPLYDTFSWKNVLAPKSKCLTLVNIPPTFLTPSYSDPYTKFLGVFINETIAVDVDNDLTRWIKSKSSSSLIYGAFGSTSIISYSRMYSLINGLAKFLFEVDNSSLLLAFDGANYVTYQGVLEALDNDQFKNVLHNNQQVRIEKGFVKQKWILKQNSVKIFLSHCGMGSTLESIYFSKPILCMPFNLDQFANAIIVVNRGIGKSLFVPSSALQSFINPYDFVKYTFTADSVTNKVFILWMDTTYEKTVAQMSLEMKHVGGLKRAVEEIEFFVKLDGNLDRFVPFQSTLWFYQRSMLDLLLIFIVLPGATMVYIIHACRRRQRRQKKKID
jgi:hypothetical protein